MSLKKNYNRIVFLIILGSVFFFRGCDPKTERVEPSVHEFLLTDSNALSLVKAKYNPAAKNAFYRPFNESEIYGVACTEEVNTIAEWGIRFVLLKPVSDSIEVVYKSSVLEGSLSEAVLKSVRINNFNYDFLYYNSGAYFIGSGGGDVYLYMVDFNMQVIYQVYGEVTSNGSLVLHLSGNIPEEIKDFFISELRAEYSSLIIGSPDGGN